jgi:hypothetical protein
VANTCTELLEEWQIPIWSSGYWGSRFAGITGGLLSDFLLEGAATSLMAGWLYDFKPTARDESGEQPLGALALLGSDALRPQYPGESEASVKTRLRAKWSFWTGNPRSGLLEELAAAGLGPAILLVPGDWSPVPDGDTDNWSRFWLIFEEGDHPITGPGTFWGGYLVGTSVLGPEGLTLEYYNQLRAIVKRYKPVQWIPWEYQFILPGGAHTIRLIGTSRPTDPYYVYYV